MPTIPTNKQFIDGQARAISEQAKENRTVTFEISNGEKDRHGTRMNMANWNLEHFNANPIIGYQHEVHGGGMCRASDPDDIIGTGRAYFDRNDAGDVVLLCDVTFERAEINPKAEKIFQKVLAGTLRATSVGIMALENEKGETGRYGFINKDGQIEDENTFYFHGQELIELSIVNVPSNRAALKRNTRDVAANALYFLRDALDVTTPDLLQMSVADVLRGLEKPGDEPAEGSIQVPPEIVRNTETEKEHEPAEGSEPKALAAIGHRVREQQIKNLKSKREQK
jgi:hypothetical protein